MSLLVLGVSHHGAPLALLEAVALDALGRGRLVEQALASEHVSEVVVLSTCNRTEVFAETGTFHGALTDLSQALADASGLPLTDLTPNLTVHYEDRAIAHAFALASGLDSLALGEAQILGQVRSALTVAQRSGSVGPSLNSLLQQALRVGKRVHTETSIDEVSGSLVDAALDGAVGLFGPLSTARVLVVGAGGMSALASTTAVRRGAASVTIVNRGWARAERLAARVGALARPWGDLPAALAEADIVLVATGASGRILTRSMVQTARSSRSGVRALDALPYAALPQVLLDLALPHDIDLDVVDVAGTHRLGLGDLGDLGAGGALGDLGDHGAGDHGAGRGLGPGETHPVLTEARDLVTGEVAAYLAMRTVEGVAPTVTALRSRAGDVVEGELARLAKRLPDLDPAAHAEVRRAVERVVDKLLHAPTVRVKRFAEQGDGGIHARALRDLFDLDPALTPLVSSPPVIPGEEGSS